MIFSLLGERSFDSGNPTGIISEELCNKYDLMLLPISDLRGYLDEYSREIKLPIQYKDLLHFESSMPVYDKEGRDTLWEIAEKFPNVSLRDIIELNGIDAYNMPKPGTRIKIKKR